MVRVSRNLKRFINSTGKKLVVFDLDGTLTESKSLMDRDMSRLLLKLLEKLPVAIIGGGRYEQFQKQLTRRIIGPKPLIKNLFLFPSNSASFYKYKGGWKKVYEESLSVAQRRRINQGFSVALKALSYKQPKRFYGEIIEDRGTEITFSALGQNAPIGLKKRWNRNSDIRSEIIKTLEKYVPDFEIHSAGLTSIDVTKKGVDKAYGLKKIKKYLNIPYKNMVFVGDALYPGGNDYAVQKTGVHCIRVSGPKDTKRLIKSVLTKIAQK